MSFLHSKSLDKDDGFTEKNLLHRWSRVIQRSSRRTDDLACSPCLSQRLRLWWSCHLQVCVSLLVSLFPPRQLSSSVFTHCCPASSFLSSLVSTFPPSPCCCPVTMVKAKRQTVVSGSWWFTVRQYLMGMTESTVLTKFQNWNEQIKVFYWPWCWDYGMVNNVLHDTGLLFPVKEVVQREKKMAHITISQPRAEVRN